MLRTSTHPAKPSPCLLMPTLPPSELGHSRSCVYDRAPTASNVSLRYASTNELTRGRRAHLTFGPSPCGCASPCAVTSHLGRSGPAPRDGAATARWTWTARGPGPRVHLPPRSESLPGLFAPRWCPAAVSYSDSSYLLLVCTALLLCKRKKNRYFNFLFSLTDLP